jgi:hypothetical protein
VEDDSMTNGQISTFLGPIGVHRRSSAVALFLLLSAAIILQAQPPFTAGETTDFDISWRVFGAGTARMTLNEVPGAAKPTWRATVEAHSIGIVTRLYKVEDVYRSTFQANSYCSEQLEKTIHEGNRNRDLKIDFDAQRKLAAIRETDTSSNRVIRQLESPIPPCAFDVISGLYYVRTLKLEVGKPFQVPLNDGSHTILVDVEVQAKEEIKTPAGVFHTIRIEPQVFGGTLFKKSGRLQIWLTDDDKHRLVQLRARLFFGNITATATK